MEKGKTSEILARTFFFFILGRRSSSPSLPRHHFSPPPPTALTPPCPSPRCSLALFLAISLYPPVLTLLALGHLAKATLAVAQTSTSVSGVLVRSCSCCLL